MEWHRALDDLESGERRSAIGIMLAGCFEQDKRLAVCGHVVNTDNLDTRLGHRQHDADCSGRSIGLHVA